MSNCPGSMTMSTPADDPREKALPVARVLSPRPQRGTYYNHTMWWTRALPQNRMSGSQQDRGVSTLSVRTGTLPISADCFR